MSEGRVRGLRSYEGLVISLEDKAVSSLEAISWTVILVSKFGLRCCSAGSNLAWSDHLLTNIFLMAQSEHKGLGYDRTLNRLL